MEGPCNALIFLGLLPDEGDDLDRLGVDTCRLGGRHDYIGPMVEVLGDGFFFAIWTSNEIGKRVDGRSTLWKREWTPFFSGHCLEEKAKVKELFE